MEIEARQWNKANGCQDKRRMHTHVSYDTRRDTASRRTSQVCLALAPVRPQFSVAYTTPLTGANRRATDVDPRDANAMVTGGGAAALASRG
jgi:hypothetical protein